MNYRIASLFWLAVVLSAGEAPVTQMDPRSDNPRFKNTSATSLGEYSETPALLEHKADPQGDAALERRSRVQNWLEAISAGGIAELTPVEQEQFTLLLGVDLLLLPEEATQPFQRLCVSALARLQKTGWWFRLAERRAVMAILGVVAQAHVAGGTQYVDAFDNIGIFESAVMQSMVEMQAAVPGAANFSELDMIESVARNAYGILASTRRAPVSTFQEMPIYAALVRRRDFLRP